MHFNLIDLSNGKDDVYKFIVDGGYYNIILNNLKSILDINEFNELDFAEKNFSFINDSGNQNLIKKINNSLSVWKKLFKSIKQSIAITTRR